jgi:hypothetical protein
MHNNCDVTYKLSKQLTSIDWILQSLNSDWCCVLEKRMNECVARNDSNRPAMMKMICDGLDRNDSGGRRVVEAANMVRERKREINHHRHLWTISYGPTICKREEPIQVVNQVTTSERSLLFEKENEMSNTTKNGLQRACICSFFRHSLFIQQSSTYLANYQSREYSRVATRWRSKQ